MANASPLGSIATVFRGHSDEVGERAGRHLADDISPMDLQGDHDPPPVTTTATISVPVHEYVEWQDGGRADVRYVDELPDPDIDGNAGDHVCLRTVVPVLRDDVIDH
jgi:hypothetical protein